MTEFTFLSRESQSKYQPALFIGVFVHSSNKRYVAVENIISIMKEWAKLSENSRETKELLNYHILTAFQLSVNCPFADVRMRFKNFLRELNCEYGIMIPKPLYTSSSLFISDKRLLNQDAILSNNDEKSKAIENCFIESGRFSNISRVLSYFPGFMNCFYASFEGLLRHPGPLSCDWRNYIAIMASAQQRCSYLVTTQTKEFLQNGGNAKWLEGIEFAPPKLQLLCELNALMAHKPWLLNAKDIENILSSKKVSKKDNWSLSELVLAIILMSTFHGLSSFVLGTGIAPEVDMEGGSYFDETYGGTNSDEMSKSNSLNDDNFLSKQTEELIDRLKRKDFPMKSDEVKESVFENCENLETFSDDPSDSQYKSKTATISANEPFAFMKDKTSKFVGPDYRLCDGHSDFEFKSLYNVFRLTDYNWTNHGMDMVSKYLKDIGELLDEEFSSILNLTDYTYFIFNIRLFESDRKLSYNESVDTWPFRQAIWYYVLRLFGMCHDDYDYHEVNIYLNKRIKQYIKKVARYPEDILASDFHNMGFTFRPDEKVQINLLASEARKQGELLYALFAVVKYFEGHVKN